MRAVVQRVKSASVEVDGVVVSRIGPGLLCLVGIRDTDQQQDVEYICKKILKTRAWPNSESQKAWDEDVTARQLDVLCVSQFTLHARVKKPKPDFSKAMGPGPARELYSKFLERLRTDYHPDRVHDGVFGAMMDVALVNDGPVTFVLDSDEGGAPQQQ